MINTHANDNWDFVPLTLGKFPINCQWIYTIKVGPNGQVDQLKVCLIAKRYTQVYGKDYDDTFSLVAKMSSIHLCLTIATMHN